jgi:hypothetical protein
VIPVHRRMMKAVSTVNARCRLELAVPGEQLASMHLSHLNAIGARATPIVSVVLASARLAPRL